MKRKLLASFMAGLMVFSAPAMQAAVSAGDVDEDYVIGGDEGYLEEWVDQDYMTEEDWNDWVDEVDYDDSYVEEDYYEENYDNYYEDSYDDEGESGNSSDNSSSSTESAAVESGVESAESTAESTAEGTSGSTVISTIPKSSIEESLNLKENDAQEWTYSAGADAWTLSIVSAVANPEIANEEGVSVSVPGAFVTGIDTDGDGKADATGATVGSSAVKGSLVIDRTAKITSSNGQIYTADTAPVIINTGAAGYSEQQNQIASTSYAKEGYINVACGNRGKQSTAADEDGNTYFTGDAPSCLVDQKCAIRFVKYNILLGNLPGSVDHFVSTGGSGGGAHAAMVAATSNHSDFYDYQIAVGAVGVYKNDDGTYSTSVTIDGKKVDISDGVWGCVAYSPITSLKEADMALAFEYYLNPNYSFNTEFQKKLAEFLSEAYMEYINGQNIRIDESLVGFDLNDDQDAADLAPLKIEYDLTKYPDTNGYGGTYLNLYQKEFISNLQWYLDNLDYAEDWTWFDSEGNAMTDAAVSAMTAAEKAKAFLEGRYARTTTGGMGGFGGPGGGGFQGGMMDGTGMPGTPPTDGGNANAEPVYNQSGEINLLADYEPEDTASTGTGAETESKESVTIPTVNTDEAGASSESAVTSESTASSGSAETAESDSVEATTVQAGTEVDLIAAEIDGLASEESEAASADTADNAAQTTGTEASTDAADNTSQTTGTEAADAADSSAASLTATDSGAPDIDLPLTSGTDSVANDAAAQTEAVAGTGLGNQAVGTPTQGTTQATGSSIDSMDYINFETMRAAYRTDIRAIENGDRFGKNIVSLYDPIAYIKDKDAEKPAWTRLVMGASEGDMSLFASLNLEIQWLLAGTDASVEWQWDGGHVPSEIFGNSFTLCVDEMFGKYADDAVTIFKTAPSRQTKNGTATEPNGTDISSWVDMSNLSKVSFSVAAAAAYRTAGASKAVPGFDVIDYGQEDYVFGSSIKDARHWDPTVLDIFENHAVELKPLFNGGSGS